GKVKRERYRMIDYAEKNERYGVAITRGNPDLLDAVNIAIRDFKAGKWAESFTRNFPDQPIPDIAATIPGIISKATLPPGTPLGQAKKGTLLDRIINRGYLIAAVKDDVPGFGYFDPQTREWSGLEVDLVKAIAEYIFGDPTKVEFRAATTQERIPRLRSFLRIFDPLFKWYAILATSLLANWWYLGIA